MNVPTSFSCNNKKLETAQIQVMGQQTVLYPYNECNASQQYKGMNS